MSKTIYIVLTDTGTLLSKAIGIYTRKDLNHASIAFDEQLTEMYSFGRKQRHNPFIGGFVKENAADGIFRDATCAILSYTVSEEDYTRMRQRICQFEMNQAQYRYNFIGLFGVALNKEIQREHAFFCSQFVATVVNECGISMFTISPNLVQPHHFAQSKCLQLIYEGNLQAYLHKVRELEESVSVRMGIFRHLALRIMA